jgi:uncharacterized SAM-binding protein YcdF (DUF218 family)
VRRPAARPFRTLTSAFAVGLALAAVFADDPARWLVVADPAQPADVALVLAGDPNFERTRTAARLWLEGQVSLLIVTGGERSPGDSATSLRDMAIALGVPPGRVLLEQVSHTTREAMVAVRPILEQLEVRRVALVTSPYNQRRAGWSARRALKGIAIVNRPAEPAGWRPEGWWKSRASRRIVLGEYAKLAYYILRGWA